MDKPSEIYHRFQKLLQTGDWAHMGEVVDIDGYTENCVGVTGWTTGLREAAANFQKLFLSAFKDIQMRELELVEQGDSLAVRTATEAVHVGTFLGCQATGRKVSWEAVDFVRLKGGRVVWRYLLNDLHGLVEQLRS